MYAVIKVGGKQYRVEQGQKLRVDRQPVDPGKRFTPEVLMTGGDAVNTDRKALKGAVSVKVLEHVRGEKIKVFKFKPKSGYKRMQGHRSELSLIEVESVGAAKKPRTRKKAAATEEATTDGA